MLYHQDSAPKPYSCEPTTKIHETLDSKPLRSSQRRDHPDKALVPNPKSYVLGLGSGKTPLGKAIEDPPHEVHRLAFRV